jgi:MipA family protein
LRNRSVQKLYRCENLVLPDSADDPDPVSAQERDDFTVHHIIRTALLVLLSAALWPRLAMAQASCSSPSAECAVVGKWEITASFGVGQRSNPIVGKSDIPLVVIPRISYYGKRFFLENLELGFTLHDGDANTFNLIATPGYDRVFFYRNDLQNIFIAGGIAAPSYTTLPVNIPPEGREFLVGKRRTTYMVGPEWTFGYGRFTGQLDALREVTGKHDGYEVRAALAAPLIRSKGSLVASAGLTWKSREVVHYYYGVDDLYEPGSAFNPFFKLRYALPLSDRWTLNAFAHYEQLSSSISNSPIVTENHVTTMFAGVVFRVR